MPFVKLDCNMLRSTLWFERLQREIFITALLMAEPVFLQESTPQLKVRSLDETGWSVPPDKRKPYGFVPAAGVGIVRLAIASNDDKDIQAGLDALEKLGDPEQSTRTPDFDGRRLVRVDGGYIVLNYGKYRERDYTAAARQKRYRDRQNAKRNTVTSRSNGVTSRRVTQAEAEAYNPSSLSSSLKSQQSKRQMTKYDLPLPPRCTIDRYGNVLDYTGRTMDVNQVRKALLRTDLPK